MPDLKRYWPYIGPCLLIFWSACLGIDFVRTPHAWGAIAYDIAAVLFLGVVLITDLRWKE